MESVCDWVYGVGGRVRGAAGPGRQLQVGGRLPVPPGQQDQFPCHCQCHRACPRSQVDRTLYSEQRRSDFVPSDASLSFDRPTPACMLVAAMLGALGAAARDTLGDGPNCGSFLAEVRFAGYVRCACCVRCLRCVRCVCCVCVRDSVARPGVVVEVACDKCVSGCARARRAACSNASSCLCLCGNGAGSAPHTPACVLLPTS